MQLILPVVALALAAHQASAYPTGALARRGPSIDPAARSLTTSLTAARVARNGVFDLSAMDMVCDGLQKLTYVDLCGMLKNALQVLPMSSSSSSDSGLSDMTATMSVATPMPSGTNDAGTGDCPGETAPSTNASTPIASETPTSSSTAATSQSAPTTRTEPVGGTTSTTSTSSGAPVTPST